MNFDWLAFLEAHGIDYEDRKGNLYVRCPMCGEADQGHHMGLSTQGKGWGCWRDRAHRGRAPQRLIQALLGCSWQEASRLAGKAAHGLLWGSGSLSDAVAAAFGTEAPPETKTLLKPKEFRPLNTQGHGRLFYGYMANRGFSYAETDNLAARFDLHYSMQGDWSYRLIVPVHDEAGSWVTWTGRAINEGAQVRYKTLTSDADKAGNGPCALLPSSDCLLALPSLIEGGSFLVIGEGPMDGMRLGLFVDEYDAHATCLFGKTMSAAQMDLIAMLRPRYDRVYLLLDPDAAMDALAMTQSCAPLGVEPIFLQGENDPGEMTAKEIRGLLEGLARTRGRA